MADTITVVMRDGDAAVWVDLPRGLFEDGDLDLSNLPAILDDGMRELHAKAGTDGQAG